MALDNSSWNTLYVLSMTVCLSTFDRKERCKTYLGSNRILHYRSKLLLINIK